MSYEDGDLTPAVLAPVIGENPDGVQTCDLCKLYSSDLDAAPALASHIEGARVWFIPADGPATMIYDGTSTDLIIADFTSPWITTADGQPVEWTVDLTERLRSQRIGTTVPHRSPADRTDRPARPQQMPRSC